MEELKLLVEMVAGLPHMALWVIAAFWAYKVVVIGSIYGVIRFGIDKLHSWLTTPKTELIQVKGILKDMVINDNATNELIDQIRRLTHRGAGTGIYLHMTDIDWLRKAIDEKLERDKK